MHDAHLPGARSEQDALVYLNNRYLDPTLGSFVSVDPMVTQTGEPHIYGHADPVVFSDPSGSDPDTSGSIQYARFQYCASGDNGTASRRGGIWTGLSEGGSGLWVCSESSAGRR